jgi:hypothetical protein
MGKCVSDCSERRGRAMHVPILWHSSERPPALALQQPVMSWRISATASKKLAIRSQFFGLTMGNRSLFSSQRVADIFSPNTAEFVAAAGSASSIPRLMGLPEVVKTFEY